MDPTEEDISDLRQKALAEIESSPTGQYHSKDVERLKTDRQWVSRFLMHHEMDKEKALKMIVSTLAWRQKFGTNEITHSNVNLQILCSGGMFPHCRDKDGRLMFIIKAKSSVKGQYKQEDVNRCLVYWFERVEKQEKGEKISVFFEMTGAGLSNMDMEFVQYLISLFRDYYPFFVNYIFIFEMSWIMNAAWKVVKSWLPGKSAELVKFVSRSDLKEFVPPGEQLVEWGGTVQYHFVFEPEFLPAAGPVTLNGQIEDSKKKVHFAEDTASNDLGGNDQTDVVKKPVPGQLLQLAPADEIVFRREDCETTGLLSMTNASSGTVAYKIKTTSPDKYRVRPSAGSIAPGAVLNITVHIQSGYSAAQLVRDKFLVMACAVQSDSLTSQQLTEVWKKTNESSVQQHRLRCSVAPSDAKEDEFSGSGLNNSAAMKLLQEMSPKLESILDEQHRLQLQIKRIRLLVVVLLFLSFAVPYYIISSYGQADTNGRTCAKFHPDL